MLPFEFGYSRIKSGATEIDLQHSLLEMDLLDERIIEDEDILNGQRYFLDIGDHSSFKVTELLFKESNQTTLFNSINNLKYSLVTFYPSHNDSPMSGLYWLAAVYVYPLEDDNRDDILQLYFLSQNYYELVENYIVDKTGKKIKTKDGKFIKVKE